MHTFDGPQGEKDLRLRAEQEYDMLIQLNTVMGSVDIRNLISAQEKVAAEFIAIVNACLSDRRREVRVIKIYEEIFHERVLNAFKTYFKKNSHSITNGDIVETIKFLNWYKDHLSLFGYVFDDARIKGGITALCEIIARKILIINIKTMKNIIRQDILEGASELDSKSELTNKTPQDVFKSINETLNAVSYCNIVDLALTLLEACQDTLLFFQDGLRVVIDKAELNGDMLMSICNVVMAFIKLTKDFVSQAEIVTSQCPKTLTAYFDAKLLNKSFASIAQKSREKMAENIIKSTVGKLKSKDFLVIDLKVMVNNISEKLEDLTGKVNQNLLSKLRVKVLKLIVAFYIQAFIDTVDKGSLKKKNIPTAINRLSDARKIIKEGFIKLVQTDNIDKTLAPMSHFEDFLARDYSLLSLTVNSLKEVYGSLLKWSTIENLLNLRESDIPKGERKKIKLVCREAYETGVDSNNKKKGLKISIKGDEDDDSLKDYDRESRSASIVSSDSSSVLHRLRSLSLIEGPKMEGHLEIEGSFFQDMFDMISGKNENSFFTIRKERMHHFKDTNAEHPLMSMDLKDVVDCRKVEQERQKFILKIKQQNGTIKEFKFKAKDERTVDMWISTINSIIDSGEMQDTFKLNYSDIVMFENTDVPLFSEIDKMPSLQYKYIRANYKRMSQAQKSSGETSSSLRRRGSFSLVAESFTQNELDIDGSGPQFGFCAKFCFKIGLVKLKTHESFVL